MRTEIILVSKLFLCTYYFIFILMLLLDIYYLMQITLLELLLCSSEI